MADAVPAPGTVDHTWLAQPVTHNPVAAMAVGVINILSN
jgi:hypothetical protein